MAGRNPFILTIVIALYRGSYRPFKRAQLNLPNRLPAEPGPVLSLVKDQERAARSRQFSRPPGVLEARMYRSVVESDQGQSDKRRALRWLEGIGIGVVVAAVILWAFV